VLLHAYAMRLSQDYKADFLQSTTSLQTQEVQSLNRIAGGGSLLVSIEILQARDIKRLLAAGANGLVMKMEEIMNQKDPGQAAHALGEAVFGPGSFVPK